MPQPDHTWILQAAFGAVLTGILYWLGNIAKWRSATDARITRVEERLSAWERELMEFMRQMRVDINNLGSKLDDYSKDVTTTKTDIRHILENQGEFRKELRDFKNVAPSKISAGCHGDCAK